MGVVAMNDLSRTVARPLHRFDEARIYSATELNQHTARVLEEINRAGHPAAVTKHGKFLALITPLADAKIESVVLSQGPTAEELVHQAQSAAAADWETDLLRDDEVGARTHATS
jgi:antitoxin (DNA-binding transcriptional repressor) of toxin-antitoxin stability system